MAWYTDALRGIFGARTITWTGESSMTGGERMMATPADTMVLNRSAYSDISTLGDIWIDSQWVCYTLEPTCRKMTSGPIAVPQGKYELVMYESPKNKMRVPLLLKVPGRDSIEIHIGNKPADTEGCILPGLGKSQDWVSDSGKAFRLLISIIETKLAQGPYFIGISGGA